MGVYMKINQLICFAFIVVMSTLLWGCEKEPYPPDGLITYPLYTITLQDEDGTVFFRLQNSFISYQVNLPDMSKEGYLFLGWSDGEELYNTTFIATKDQTLIAVYESLYLDYTIVKDDALMTATIMDYTGSQTHLVIPEFIDGYLITEIGYGAFQDSTLVEVDIPASVQMIDYDAFKGSSLLEQISFYGEYQGYKTVSFNQEEYDLLLESNPTACVITSGSFESGSYTFDEGCLISEVESLTSIVVLDKVYTTYHSIIDLKYYDELNYVEIRDFAFANCELLTSIALPSRLSQFNPRIIEGSNQISDISIFGESGAYQIVDQVMYSYDLTELIYYPGGLTATSYTIADTTESIEARAFVNDSLVTINIPYTVDYIEMGAFAYATSLEQFAITGESSDYHVIDGVLFKNTTLISYPANKAGSSYDIPNDITCIYDYAFANNKNLETLNLNDQITWIESYAFMGTQKITRLDWPSSVVNIGMSVMFYSSIEIIVVHRSIIVDGSITMIGFTHSPDWLPIFYVPDDSYDAYVDDLGWTYIQADIHRISELID